MANSKRQLFQKRRMRVRNKLKKMARGRLRMSVHRSSKNLSVQIIDDALDYSASGEKIGKNIGDDLAEGNPTLPLIRAMQVGSPDQKFIAGGPTQFFQAR